VSALAIVPKVMSVTDVAEHEGVTVRTIERWIEQGLLPAHRKPGGRGWTILADEYASWLRSRCSVESKQTDSAGAA
jgi:excisionase family DNA binding protein